MSNLRSVVVALMLVDAFATPGAQVGAPPRIPASDIASHVGSIATVCGRVVTYRCPLPSRTTFLDLDTPYWDEGVSLRIPPDARSRFHPRIEDTYFSKKLCAMGRVEKGEKRYIVTMGTPDALLLEGPQIPEVLFAPNAVSSCDANVELPTPTHQEKPRYSASALAARLEGIVLVEASVQTNGTVAFSRVLHSLDPSLDQEAVRAVNEWRFEPGKQSGTTVPMVITVQMSFSVRQR